MPGPFDCELGSFRLKVSGREQSAPLKRAFSYTKEDSFTVYAQEECVVLIGTEDFLGGGAFTKEEGLSGKLSLDLARFFHSEAKCDPSEAFAFVFAGKTFQNIEAEEGDFTLLDKLGHLEAGKISQGVSYVDLPLLAFLALRKLGLKVENIEMLRYDIAEYKDRFYIEGDDSANAFSIERK